MPAQFPTWHCDRFSTNENCSFRPPLTHRKSNTRRHGHPPALPWSLYNLPRFALFYLAASWPDALMIDSQDGASQAAPSRMTDRSRERLLSHATRLAPLSKEGLVTARGVACVLLPCRARLACLRRAFSSITHAFGRQGAHYQPVESPIAAEAQLWGRKHV